MLLITFLWPLLTHCSILYSSSLLIMFSEQKQEVHGCHILMKFCGICLTDLSLLVKKLPHQLLIEYTSRASLATPGKLNYGMCMIRPCLKRLHLLILKCFEKFLFPPPNVVKNSEGEGWLIECSEGGISFKTPCK